MGALGTGVQTVLFRSHLGGRTSPGKSVQAHGSKITKASAKARFHDHVEADLIERPAPCRVVEAAQGNRRLVRPAPEIGVEQPFLDRGLKPAALRPFGHRAGLLHPEDRKSVVSGKSVSGRLDLGGRRLIKKKKNKNKTRRYACTIKN